MRNRLAKKLRRAAEFETVGQGRSVTRKLYKKLKKAYKGAKGQL